MEREINWETSRFAELTPDELYAILYLRCKIFVVEQNAPYQDMDYKDQKALHVHGYVDGRLVAYCRIFRKGDYFDEACIGRVIVAEEYRKRGYGHALMNEAIRLAESALSETTIVISAQAHLQKFYESHDFVRISEPYLEDGIPHIRMKKG
jgi:ElaA protein